MPVDGGQTPLECGEALKTQNGKASRSRRTPVVSQPSRSDAPRAGSWIRAGARSRPEVHANINRWSSRNGESTRTLNSVHGLLNICLMKRVCPKDLYLKQDQLIWIRGPRREALVANVAEWQLESVSGTMFLRVEPVHWAILVPAARSRGIAFQYLSQIQP